MWTEPCTIGLPCQHFFYLMKNYLKARGHMWACPTIVFIIASQVHTADSPWSRPCHPHARWIPRGWLPDQTLWLMTQSWDAVARQIFISSIVLQLLSPLLLYFLLCCIPLSLALAGDPLLQGKKEAGPRGVLIFHWLFGVEYTMYPVHVYICLLQEDGHPPRVFIVYSSSVSVGKMK